MTIRRCDHRAEERRRLLIAYLAEGDATTLELALRLCRERHDLLGVQTCARDTVTLDLRRIMESDGPVRQIRPGGHRKGVATPAVWGLK